MNNLREQQWSRSDASDNSEDTIISRFERQVAAVPDKVALVTEEVSLTYRALDLMASRIAAMLASLPSQRDRPIVLFMKDEADRIAAMLGALKASRIFIPLAPNSPAKWVTQVIEDSGTALIIVDSSTCSIVDRATTGDVIVMEVEEFARSSQPFVADRTASPDDTAYIVYTSGSTGRPKGVANSHRRLMRTTDVRYAVFGLGRSDRYANLTSSGLARAITNTFLPLLSGGCLFPFDLHRQGLQKLALWLIAQKITYVWFSGSLLRSWLASLPDDLRFPALRFVGATGERLFAQDVIRITRHLEGDWRIGHSYSSTEAGVIAAQVFTYSHLPDAGIVAVGPPVDGVEVRLTDETGALVPPGETGEILVRSRFLAQGYWNNPDLTAKVFQTDPLDSAICTYRTGDLGRWRNDGTLELLGRKGRTIRLRGYNVEPFEVECELMRQPAVTDALVLLHDRAGGQEPCLVGYVVAPANASPSAIRKELAERLPSYMVPSHIVVLDSFPIATSGKIDRDALPPPDVEDAGLAAYCPPSDDLERELCAIWQEVLKLPKIGIDDDFFFKLGGDSLQALMMFAEIEARLGCGLSPANIVQAPTIARLADFIRATTGIAASQSSDEFRRMGVTKTPPVVRVPRAAIMSMSLLQEAIWNHCPHFGARFIQTHSHRVIGPLDIEILKECLTYLIDRHEILRTTFGLVEGYPVQIIHQSAPLSFSYVDLIDANDPEGQADSIIREESSREIDLAKLPIRRNLLIRIASNNYRLVRISHPLISDGFASQLLDAELATLYEAMLHGKEPPLPKEPLLQYADYAVWQRQVMRPDGPYFNEVMRWWKGLSTVPRATRLPFRRLIRREPLNPSEGVLPWKLAEQTAKRLDEIARSVGATHFTVRLAAFAALIADVTDSSTIVIGTAFANRNRVETQNIVGPFLNTVHLIFSYDANRTFLDWLAFLRDRVFEATTRAELPYDNLRASGVQPPEIEFYFRMLRDHSDQHFGNLAISGEFFSIGTMPSKCMFDIDERKPENCRVLFDANAYDGNEMRAMLDRYLRLLEVAAREPELPLGKLLRMAGAKPLRWTCATYAAPFYEFITAFYASSPLLKMFWRPIRRWVLSGS